MRWVSRILVALLVGFLPTLGYAHGDPATGGFLSGIQHPVLGFDHLLAMVSVGVISALIGGRAIWLIPTIFVVVMMLGGLTGLYGIPIPLVSIEQGIAASVVVLGLGIVSYDRVPAVVVGAFVAFFAIFHGHAHGLEIPADALPVAYVVGFMTGTALLHLSGVLLGFFGNLSETSGWLLRTVGVAVSGTGVAFFLVR